ncbi:LPS export ABC transporter permease LptF [Citrifermentans pelophilum]|nr:LPS export ABC transporter permease LptF [Geoanaerobacter pelophilus]
MYISHHLFHGKAFLSLRFTWQRFSCIIAAMPSTIDRYIFREITIPFLLGMTAFTGALLMGRFLKIAEMVVAKGVPLSKICLLIAYLLPSFALVTIPMAFLLAILLAFGRLSADSEIIAMKASGVGLSRLMAPVMAFAVITAISTLAIAVYAVPAGNTSFKELLTKAIEGNTDLDIRERVFVDTIPGLVIYVESYNSNSRTMKGVMIQDDRKPENPLTIFAGRGTVSIDTRSRRAHLLLEGGSIHNIHEDSYRLVNFREYELNLKLDQSIRAISRNELDMSLAELNAGINGSAKDPRLRKDMELEYHRRFATPFACFVFALAGVPLGIQNRRSGKGGGFAVSIGLLIVYYIVLSAAKTAGEKDLLNAALAMWLPNVIFLALGGWFFFRSAQEKSVLGPLAPAAIADFFVKIFSGAGKTR